MVKQVKGGFAPNANGTRSFYHGATGDKLVSTFFTSGDNNWYYADAREKSLSVNRLSTDNIFYFDQTGRQVKGTTASNPDGSISYYDVHTGTRLLIAGLRFLQVNRYTSILKEKATCQIKN